MKTLAIKKTLLTLIAAMTLMFSYGFVQDVSAAPKDEACKALEAIGETCADTGDGSGQSRIAELATDVINILSWIVGIAAVIMIIIGGFRYLTSAGDPGNTAAARNTIIYAIVGLVIVAFSQAIVAFVLSRL